MARLCHTFIILCLIASNSYGQINTHFTASVVEGVAPLAVYFDATKTTHQDNTIDVFHDLNYNWNFGDLNSGIWKFKPSSQNTATGPLTAHVFDSIGVFIVELEVFDKDGNSDISTIVIRVKPAKEYFRTGKTICFSTNEEFGGCPNFAQKVKISGNDLNEIKAFVGNDTRLLFKRGDTIKTDYPLDIKWVNNFTIGAFGNGLVINENNIYENAPIFKSNKGNSIFNISSPDGTRQAQNITIMDVHLVGEHTINQNAIYCEDYTQHNLIYRVHTTGYTKAIHYNYKNLRDSLHKQELFDHITIAKCWVEQGRGVSNLVDISGYRIALLGNDFEYANKNGHVLEAPWVQKGVLLHNRIMYPAKHKACLKLGSPASDTLFERTATKEIVIADNHFETYKGSKHIVNIMPSSKQSKMLHDIIFERNFVNTGNDNKVLHGIIIAGQDITVRNNIFNGTGASPKRFTGITILDVALSNPTKNITACNNTIYKDDKVKTAVGIKIDADVKKAMVRNNLVYSPKADDIKITEDYGEQTLASNNMYPYVHPFVSKKPNTPLDFQLDSISQLLDKGEPITCVYSDFYGQKRPLNTLYNIGAFEYTETPITITDFSGLSASSIHEYPNPSRQYMTFDLSKISGHYSIEIFDTSENLIYSDFNLENPFYIWRIDDYENGIYWVKIASKGATFLTKALIER